MMVENDEMVDDEMVDVILGWMRWSIFISFLIFVEVNLSCNFFRF